MKMRFQIPKPGMVKRDVADTVKARYLREGVHRLVETLSLRELEVFFNAKYNDTPDYLQVQFSTPELLKEHRAFLNCLDANIEVEDAFYRARRLDVNSKNDILGAEFPPNNWDCE